MHGCCHRLLSEFPFAGDELVYSDPPYLHPTRKSQRRYRYDDTQADHEQLLALAKGLPWAVMISGYPSELCERTLQGWHSLSLQVMNQAGVVTENVWCNFASGGAHWHTYAARTSRTARASSARPPTGPSAMRPWSRASAWRCWPP